MLSQADDDDDDDSDKLMVIVDKDHDYRFTISKFTQNKKDNNKTSLHYCIANP